VLKLTTDRHEASRGLSATAELLSHWRQQAIALIKSDCVEKFVREKSRHSKTNGV